MMDTGGGRLRNQKRGGRCRDGRSSKGGGDEGGGGCCQFSTTHDANVKKDHEMVFSSYSHFRIFLFVGLGSVGTGLDWIGLDRTLWG